MIENFRKLKILVTGGPTWVAIDKVRVITNIFSGRLSYAIVEEAARKGATVTFLFGPGRINIDGLKNKKNVKIIRYKFFDELFTYMKKEISSGKYNVVVHSAAVADYKPIPFKGKIKSGKNELILKLKPVLKIVNQIKKWDSKIFLVKFKLEVDVKRKRLMNIALKSMKESNADLVVANEFSETLKKDRVAYIIGRNKKIKKVVGKKMIAHEILNSI